MWNKEGFDNYLPGERLYLTIHIKYQVGQVIIHLTAIQFISSCCSILNASPRYLSTLSSFLFSILYICTLVKLPKQRSQVNPGHNQEPSLKYITNLSTLTNLSSYYLQSKPVTYYNLRITTTNRSLVSVDSLRPLVCLLANKVLWNLLGVELFSATARTSLRAKGIEFALLIDLTKSGKIRIGSTPIYGCKGATWKEDPQTYLQGWLTPYLQERSPGRTKTNTST